MQLEQKILMRLRKANYVRISFSLTPALSQWERAYARRPQSPLSPRERVRVRAITKCIALGASLGGMAGQFLKAAAFSTEKAVEVMKLTKKQIEVTMFAAGAKNIDALKQDKIREN